MMISPDRLIRKWNGRPSTPVTLCRSRIRRRGFLSGRKVKKSEKILRWMITPETHNTIIAMPANPTIQYPMSRARTCSM